MRSPHAKVRQRAQPRRHGHEKSESMKRDALDTSPLHHRDSGEGVRACSAFLVSVVIGAGSIGARGDDAQPTRSLRINTPAADSTCIVTISYTAEGANARRAEAVSVAIDGTSAQELLIFPAAGTREYGTLIGPLSAGPHTITITPSRFWPSAAAGISAARARVVAPDDADATVMRFAPAIWARADTIGTSSDLPLLMYVESQKAGNEAETLTYSIVFSNEDGGTPARALMARWGRMTDIEWLYAVHIERGIANQETFQSVNHDTRAFAGRHLGTHPLLTVATLNNSFPTVAGVGSCFALFPGSSTSVVQRASR